MKKLRPGSFPGPFRVSVVMFLSSLILLGTSYFFIKAQTTTQEDELTASDFSDDLTAGWEKGDGEYMLPADSGSTLAFHVFSDSNDPICDDCGLIRLLQVADLEAPVTGSSLDKSITLSASSGVSSSVTWSPSDSKAKEDTVYTVTITFSPKSGYHFDATTTASIDGETVSVSRVNSRISITKTFAKTGPAPSVVTYGDWEYEPATGKLTKYIGTKTDVSVPTRLNGTKITMIGDKTFSGNTSITSVTIPGAITSVGERAFAYCTSLQKVSFNDGLKELGNYAFSSCSSLTDVSFPDSLTKIPFAAFWKCSGLKDVTFGKSIQTLAASSFIECGLTHVCLPADIYKAAVSAGAFDSKVTLHNYDGSADPTCADCGFIRFLNIADLDKPVSGTLIDKSFSFAASSVCGSSISWSPSDRFAKPSTVYTVTFTFSANYGYHFDSSTTASLNGSSVDVELVSERKIIVTKTYPSTAAPTPTATPSPKATPTTKPVTPVPGKPTPTKSATKAPTKTPNTPTPTRRPDDPRLTPTDAPTPTNTPKPTRKPILPTITPTNTPTNTPKPTYTPTPTDTPAPTNMPTPTPTLAVIQMPDVIGKNYENAEKTIASKLTEYVYAEVTFEIKWVENEDPQKNMTVLEQDPKAGEYLYGNHSSSKTVTLTVAKEAPGTEEEPTFEDFVERLYTVALNRASEPEGKEFWVKQVVEEGKTGADCARFFLLEADEFMKRGLSVDEFVETLYATFFDRESDPAGKQGWVTAIQTGAKTRAEVVNDFIESTEWCNVCATYGVKSGALYHKATIPSRNALKFAERLYTCCLGREAEEDGLQFWALRLTNLEESGYSAAEQFFESDEFIGFRTSDEEFLCRLYRTFMDREADDGGLKYWMDLMKAGRTRRGVIYDFANSPEFLQICRSYGIDTGMEKVDE